jgi:hypothetical protein
MKICYVGNLKPKFILQINPDLDEVVEVKSRILEKLGLITTNKDDQNYAQINRNPHFLKMRLFMLRGGNELMNSDHMESVAGTYLLFYSFGKYWIKLTY